MADVVRRIAWPPEPTDPESLVTREWLVTNGLGGYASGTVLGVDHAAVSRAADRRPAGAAGPHRCC